VGVKGSRIHGIVRELGNENIDVINYTKNEQLFISRALSPAKVTSMEIEMYEEDQTQSYLNYIQLLFFLRYLLLQCITLLRIIYLFPL